MLLKATFVLEQSIGAVRRGDHTHPSKELPTVLLGFLDSKLGVPLGQVSLPTPPPVPSGICAKTNFFLIFVFPEKLDFSLGL